MARTKKKVYVKDFVYEVRVSATKLDDPDEIREDIENILGDEGYSVYVDFVRERKQE